MRVESVPVVGLGERIPRPVRGFKVFKDDSGLGIFFRRIAPDIKFALGRTGGRFSRFLKPGVLIRGVIDHELGDNAQPAEVRLSEKRAEILERTIIWINAVVISDVVAVVSQRRRIKWQEPDRSDAKLFEVIELLDKAAEIADAVAIAIVKRFDVQLVDDRVFVPEWVSNWFFCVSGHQ